MNTLVISAYPACGKSVYFRNNSIHAGNRDGKKILDSDSSLFSWLHDEGVKTDIRNPDFPNNYIKYIKKRIGKEDIIFVSSHKVVREALSKANIPYISIFPTDNITNMKEWKARFIERGNTQSFVEFQMEHWTEFIQDMENDSTPIRKIRLDVYNGFPYINDELINYILEG